MYIQPNTVFNDSLSHYGIPGMKWGVRRYDYVPVGRKAKSTASKLKPSSQINRMASARNRIKANSEKTGVVKTSKDQKELTPEQIAKREKLKKIAKYTALAGGIALGAYGAYKINSMNKEQQAKLLESLARIDKNVTTKGWDRNVQAKLMKEVETSWKLGQDASKRAEELYSAKTKSMMTELHADVIGWSREQRNSHNAKIAAGFDMRLDRANKAAQAAGVLNMIKEKELKEYSQLDPRNVTKLQAASKTFKSSTGNVKNAIKDAGLTKAAKLEKAKDAIEAKRVQDIENKILSIQKNDAKKILQAYAKDPDGFINGTVDVPDYMAISQNKIERLRKQILKSH